MIQLKLRTVTAAFKISRALAVPQADEHEADKMEVEDPVEPPLVQTSTRIPSWKRELAAPSAVHDRVGTRYGLRERPTKTQLY